MFFRKSWSKQPIIVEGKAVSLINIAMLMGQGGAALLVGPIVDAVGDKRILMLIPSAAVTTAMLAVVFNDMPDVVL